MGQITAYKCDHCGTITEEPVLSFKSSLYEFKIEEFRSYRHCDCLCSVECAYAELAKWNRERIDREAKEAEEEAKAIVDRAEQRLSGDIASAVVAAHEMPGELHVEKVS